MKQHHFVARPAVIIEERIEDGLTFYEAHQLVNGKITITGVGLTRNEARMKLEEKLK